METRTICCKLSTMQPSYEALQETSFAFSEACNFVLKTAIEAKTYNAIKLHQICYAKVRDLFGLSANLSIRAIRRVVACMTKLKGKRKCPKVFKPKSIDYDARIFSYREQEETVSLTTTKGRIRIPLTLKGQNPTSATVINKSSVWYIHVVVEFESTRCEGNGVMGIDFGITNIVTTSTGSKIEGKSRQEFKAKKARVRASLQSRGKKGPRKVLKKISGNERRRIKHENHVISKQLVEEAKRHNCGVIRMELLKDIRSKTKTWNKHRNCMMAGWSFYQLQKFVSYKASAASIAIEYVNPAYTTQTCHRCLKLGSRDGECFNCLTCGEQHADVNASHMIALGGAACKPARISSLG
ncbi:MAG: RNA-guided endonuclease TnpB family protein [Parachlamydia sp.]|nr:RNA-guided endonuclease TnpB family protein [Parachlamydia sp.]